MPTAILKDSRNGRLQSQIADHKSQIVLTSEQRETISHYIRARRLLAEAQTLAEKLKTPTLSIVGMAGGLVKHLDAIVLIGQSTTYDYPPIITRQEDKLKTLKRIMQLDGRAQKIEKDCLIFKDLEKTGVA